MITDKQKKVCGELFRRTGEMLDETIDSYGLDNDTVRGIVDMLINHLAIISVKYGDERNTPVEVMNNFFQCVEMNRGRQDETIH